MVPIIFVLTVVSASAQTRMTREEAFSLWFPGATIERRTAFLSEEEMRSVRALAKAPVESRILTYYEVRRNDTLDAVVMLETSVVKTLPATYMVVIDPDTTIRAVELLAFFEPADYAPPRRWLDQFAGKRSADGLFVKREIAAMTGATLSAEALTAGARRSLAAFRTIVARKLAR
jgi:hypothetical protein